MKLLLIANGNAESPRTWSGVPERVLVELRRQGHKVVSLDMSEVKWIKIPRVLFNRIVRKIWRPWRWVAFETTGLGIALQSRWLRSAVKKHPECDKVIVFSYCVDAKGVDRPVILIHDWTNGYLQQLFHCRPMTAVEKAGDARQFAAMRSATKVVSLYPKAAEYMRAAVGDKVKFYCNPINTDEVPDVEALIAGGLHSKHILLVGGSTYQSNVECVIQAANLIGDPGIVIDVVGVSSAKTKPVGYRVNFHGYLNKAIPEQKEKYDRLFREARCFVNVRKGWGGGSSVAEALYKGLPVVVGNYADIVGLYGNKEDFGCYCTPANVNELAQKIQYLMMLSADEYAFFCRTAHGKVANDTYAAFVQEVLSGK